EQIEDNAANSNEIELFHSAVTSRDFHYWGLTSGRLARGSRSLAVAVDGCVTNGPPSIGAAEVNATSGISLGKPSSGKSFLSGKNGYPSHIRIRRRSGWLLKRMPIMS